MSQTPDGEFKSLPKWPDAAKDLPDEDRFVRRDRREWSIGGGAAGVAVAWLLFRGLPDAFLVVLMLGGLSVGVFLALAFERSMYERQRREDRWS